MQVLLRELPWHLQAVERRIIYSIKKNKPFPPNKYISEDELQGASLNLKRTIIREKLGRIWCENWAQSEKGRITHSFICAGSDVSAATRGPVVSPLGGLNIDIAAVPPPGTAPRNLQPKVVILG
ncbi:hypothetical protein Zmor_004051 [Zophobas morio]|uniref:Uncharacterized protein n=1 Tax=Zophobas morio TaxID=2755281 RepID=A0AA38HL29_9CUCU|nr:hypothetical protein Zmor_004051 [Zophobas morio]